MDGWTELLTKSLIEAPLLVQDLDVAKSLDRSLLGTPDPVHQLNFRQKLGHVYEDALAHLIQQSEQLSLVGSNLQVFDASDITLGEMDFLVRDETKECHYHLELAVKFYLGKKTGAEWSFPGPDPRDNWARKLERMRSHQLKLADSPHAKDLLVEQFGIVDLSVRQLIYGRFFLPIDAEGSVLPEAMHRDGLRGRWLSRCQWPQHIRSSSKLRVIPKPLWPVPISATLVERLPEINQAELFEKAQERCTMFLTEESQEPLFLVPDSWLGCV